MADYQKRSFGLCSFPLSSTFVHSPFLAHASLHKWQKCLCRQLELPPSESQGCFFSPEGRKTGSWDALLQQFDVGMSLEMHGGFIARTPACFLVRFLWSKALPAADGLMPCCQPFPQTNSGRQYWGGGGSSTDWGGGKGPCVLSWCWEGKMLLTCLFFA